jgi:hypothetical protein
MLLYILLCETFLVFSSSKCITEIPRVIVADNTAAALKAIILPLYLSAISFSLSLFLPLTPTHSKLHYTKALKPSSRVVVVRVVRTPHLWERSNLTFW